MRGPLYISEYDAKASKRAKRASHLGREINWSERLPVVWRSLAIGPLWVDVHRDLELASERWVGYDEEESPCYCRYRFRVEGGVRDGLTGDANDGGYSEDLAAWRMRDGRWLIHRIIMCQVSAITSYGFYAFSESMPR